MAATPEMTQRFRRAPAAILPSASRPPSSTSASSTAAPSSRLKTMAEDRRLYTDLLSAMAGHLDRRFYLEPGDHHSIQWADLEASLKADSPRSVLPIVGDLLELASMYIRLHKDYLELWEMDLNPIKVLLCGLAKQALIEYHEEIVRLDLEGCRQQNPLPVIALNRLLRFRARFTDTLDFFDRLTEDNAVFTLMKLSLVYCDRYEIPFSQDQNWDPFFQGVCSWMLTGSVPASFVVFFFIHPRKRTLDWAKFPAGIIEPRFGEEIFAIGNLVWLVNNKGHKLDSLAVDDQLDRKKKAAFIKAAFARRSELYSSSGEFRAFLAQAKDFVHQNVLPVTEARREFVDFLALLRAFYLFEDEFFWAGYFRVTRKATGAHNLKHFRQALNEAYEEAEADRLLRLVQVAFATVVDDDEDSEQIKKKKKKSSLQPAPFAPPLRLTIKPGVLVRIFYAEETTLHYYQTIFSHLYQLHAARNALISGWIRWKEGELRRKSKKKKKLKISELDWEEVEADGFEADSLQSRRRSKCLYLLHHLLRLTSQLLTFSHFVVREVMADLERVLQTSSTSGDKVEALQKGHERSLRLIVKRLLIGSRFSKLQERLLALTAEHLQSATGENGGGGGDVDELLERYTLIVTEYQAFFEENHPEVHLHELLVTVRGILEHQM